jgi:hypothetical protein
MTYEQGVADEQARVIALLDEYDITELRGGVIMLRPKTLPRENVEHTTGSLTSYFKRGCRCDACKGVAREWRANRLSGLDEAQKQVKRAYKTELQRLRRAVSA